MLLQTRILELQQRLAQAVSADRKKDVMIEQLDKTLAKVVEGWRRHEEEKTEAMKRLQLEREEEKRKHAKEGHVKELEQRLSERQRECERVCGEYDQVCVERERLRGQLQETEETLAHLQEEAASEKRALEQQTAQMANHLKDEKAVVQRVEQCVEELRVERSNLRRDLEDDRRRKEELEGEREEARRERDAERLERALDQARCETQRSQLEMEVKQTSGRLMDLQNTHTLLKEQHRKQLVDLKTLHDNDTSALKQQHLDDTHTLTQAFTHRLSYAQQQCVGLEESRRRLEAQKKELVARLQALLRSHWTEAQRLLTTQSRAGAVNCSIMFPWSEGKSSPPLKREVGVSQPTAPARNSAVSKATNQGSRGRGQGSGPGKRGSGGVWK
ncbi:centrobin [Aplochiton taeniatus]